MRTAGAKKRGPAKGSRRKPYIKDVPGLLGRMHRDHLGGMKLVDLGRKYGYRDGNIAAAFRRARLKVIVDPRAGCFQRTLKRKTKWEIRRLAKTMTRVIVHPEIKTEWREWSWEKRRWWIDLVRSHLGPEHSRPAGPFSANVEPFDYTTKNARRVIAASNEGKSSWVAGCKIKVGSQGVIWDGRLWFWSAKAGYVEGVSWTPEHGRPMLHQVIWERAHGTPVPLGHVVRHIDGNPNNLAPANLVLASRNAVARENQAEALQRKSRLKTQALLGLSQAGDAQIFKLKHQCSCP